MLKNIIRKYKYMFYVLVLFLFSLPLFVDLLTLKQTEASVLGLPEPNSLLSLAPKYNPPMLRGLKIDPENPLKLDFVLELNDSNHFSETESRKLMNYFLSALATPNDDLWVNLSPYEVDRIIDSQLNGTQIASALLKQDYILKQLASSMSHPESALGENFWQDKEFDTAAKIWISPKASEIVEQNNFVIIADASLNVQSEKEFFAQENAAMKNEQSSFIKELSKQVNEGKHFSELRQIYNVLILATWFKQKYKNSFYKAYIDSHRIDNLRKDDKELKDKIWALYCQSFNKGVYSLHKKAYDINSKSRKKKSYISGGYTNKTMTLASSLFTFNEVVQRLDDDLNILSLDLNVLDVPDQKESSSIELVGVGLVAAAAYYITNLVFDLRKKAKERKEQEEAELVLAELFDERIEWEIRDESKLYDIINDLKLSTDEVKRLLSLLAGELIAPLKFGVDGRVLGPRLFKMSMKGYPLLEIFMSDYVERRSEEAYLRSDLELYRLRSMLDEWGVVAHGFDAFIKSDLDEYLQEDFGQDYFSKTFERIFSDMRTNRINVLFSMDIDDVIAKAETKASLGLPIDEVFVNPRMAEARQIDRMDRLGQRASEKLLAIIENSDARSVEFKKAAYFLMALQNMFTYQSFREIYYKSSDPLKKAWLCSLARQVLIANLYIGRKDEKTNINHFTFTDRLESRSDLLRALLPRLSVNPLVYDLASSNGSTSFKLAKDLRDHDFKLKAVDLETEFYDVNHEGIRVLFNYEGDVIQLVYDNKIFGRNHTSLKEINAKEKKLLDAAKQKFLKKDYEKISIVDFRAQDYSKGNPQRLEFGQSDIFSDNFSLVDADLVLVSNLFIPGLYFSPEQIIDKVHDLWHKVKDGTYLYLSYQAPMKRERRILLQKSKKDGNWKKIDFSTLSPELGETLKGPTFLDVYQEALLGPVKQSSNVEAFGGLDFTELGGLDVEAEFMDLGNVDLGEEFYGFSIKELSISGLSKDEILEMAA